MFRLPLTLLTLVSLLVLPLLAAPDAVQLEKARAAAIDELVDGLTELAEWCVKKKIFIERDEVCQAILELEPRNSYALRGLGWWLDKEGEWQPPKPGRMAPRNYSKSALKKFPELRKQLTRPFRDSLLKLLVDYEEDLTPKKRDDILDQILAIEPDDERVHELRGEAQLNGVWVMVETVAAKKGRAELRESVRKAFASVPEPSGALVGYSDELLGVSWAYCLSTPQLRVLGVGPRDEGDRAARALSATLAHFNTVFCCEAAYSGECRAFVLSPDSKAGFIEGYPDLAPERREFLRKLDGSSLQARDFAHWGATEALRIDGLTRQAMSLLMASQFGVTTRHGLFHEGFGLYLGRELVGTRLTWFVQPSEYLTPEAEQELKTRLVDTRTNWMNEANKVLTGERSPSLKFTLGKDVNSLTTEELLLSYVTAAYLLEAHGAKVPALMRDVGQGTPPHEAIAKALDMSVLELDQRLRRWLTERK